MAYTRSELRCIYDRTTGYCHICHKKLAFTNYASFGPRGAWEVDHSHPRVNGGTDHGNNLLAACISCNRSKCKDTAAMARTLNGKKRAPFCAEKRRDEKFKNGLLGAVAGGVCGAVLGPGGALLGSIIGGCVGSSQNPDKL